VWLANCYFASHRLTISTCIKDAGNLPLQKVCLANCYAGRFYLLYESELSLTFGTHLVAGKLSDREMLCDWETVNDFLEVLQRSTEYCSQGESLINQAAAGVW
jgi:hypothetical protein